MYVYSVYDRIAEEASPVFCAVNDGVAARQFRSEFDRPGAMSATDFKLYRLGKLDRSAIRLEALDVAVEVPVIHQISEVDV